MFEFLKKAVAAADSLAKKAALASVPEALNVKALLAADLPGSWSPLRGWANFGLFEVHGVNPKTGRSNKKMLEALDEADAAERAGRLFGLVAPFTISERSRSMATEAQIEYGASLGVKIDGQRMSQLDASALICRVNDGDGVRDILSREEWDAACKAGVTVSALAGHKMYRSAMKYARRAGGGR